MTKRDVKLLTGAIIIIMLAVIISLIYAAFTKQLNISGSAVNRKSNWDIHFENLSSVTTTGSGKALTQPRIASPTSIEDYSVSTTSPGDTVSFTFKVVNDGNYNASISSVSVGTPECSGTDSTSNSNVCGKLTYSLTYDNGSTVQVGDSLYAKESVTMKVTLSYAEFNDPSLLATEDVSISNLGITINYTQSGSAEVGDNGVVQNNRVYHQGDKITLNNEDYYVIANSGAGQDYVVALKDKPLTTSEVNQYGGVGTANNHVNKNAFGTVGTAYNKNGYGAIAYYSGENCGLTDVSQPWGSTVNTGCTNDYDESDIKYVVDSWALDKFQNDELKSIDSYRARLITNVEYNAISNNFVWRYNSSRYWTMDSNPNNTYQACGVGPGDVTGCGSQVLQGYNSGLVRPVINVYKSALETNSNNSSNNSE